MTLRRCALLLVGVLLPATVLWAVPASGSDPCPQAGVRVLVDFGELAAAEAGEERVRIGCDPEASDDRATASIADAGFELEHATRNPGFVCRVAGVPTEDPCVNAAPADAYWSVWWAAEDGDWVYSSRGVGTLRSPQGGDLALVWHEGDGRAAPPSVAPGSADGGSPPAATGPAPAAPESSLPVWVPAGVLAALLVAAGVVARRRRG